MDSTSFFRTTLYFPARSSTTVSNISYELGSCKYVADSCSCPILSCLSQTAALEATRKTAASRINSSEYENIFMFGEYLLEEFAEILPALPTSGQIETTDFLSTYTEKMLTNKRLGNVAEVQFVQPVSRLLLKQTMDIAFTKEEVSCEEEQPFACPYRGQIYHGKTDHVIVSALRDAAVLVWEDKALDIDFAKKGVKRSALCQVAAEIYSEVHRMSYKYNYTAEHFCGILTNGIIWILVVYFLNRGVQQWRHCKEVVCSADSDSLRRVTVMLRLALASARHHVDALKKCTIAASPHIIDNIVDIDDDDDGHNGDVTCTDAIGALTKSIATTMQFTERTSSADGGKRTADGGKRNTRSGHGGDSAKNQKHMHILSLTENHLALHNKENCVIPWIGREIVVKLYHSIS